MLRAVADTRTPQCDGAPPSITNLAPRAWFEVPFRPVFFDHITHNFITRPTTYLTDADGQLLQGHTMRILPVVIKLIKALEDIKTPAGTPLWREDSEDWGSDYPEHLTKSRYVSLANGFLQAKITVLPDFVDEMKASHHRIAIRVGPSERVMGLHNTYETDGPFPAPHTKIAPFFPPDHHDALADARGNRCYCR